MVSPSLFIVHIHDCACTVCRSLNYTDVVTQVTEASMSLAVNGVKELRHYSESGDVHVYTCVCPSVDTHGQCS